MLFQQLNKDQGVLWVVIDNLRYDQYRILEPLINNFYKKEEEHSYFQFYQLQLNMQEMQFFLD